MIEYFDMSTWPLWAKLIGIPIGIIGLLKLITVPYWGPSV